MTIIRNLSILRYWALYSQYDITQITASNVSVSEEFLLVYREMVLFLTNVGVEDDGVYLRPLTLDTTSY